MFVVSVEALTASAPSVCVVLFIPSVFPNASFAKFNCCSKSIPLKALSFESELKFILNESPIPLMPITSYLLF